MTDQVKEPRICNFCKKKDPSEKHDKRNCHLRIKMEKKKNWKKKNKLFKKKSWKEKRH